MNEQANAENEMKNKERKHNNIYNAWPLGWYDTIHGTLVSISHISEKRLKLLANDKDWNVKQGGI